ncbi:MAG: hypothetical protein AB7S38_26925 [Vulcanimicrobiota bacterium]
MKNWWLILVLLLGCQPPPPETHYVNRALGYRVQRVGWKLIPTRGQRADQASLIRLQRVFGPASGGEAKVVMKDGNLTVESGTLVDLKIGLTGETTPSELEKWILERADGGDYDVRRSTIGGTQAFRIFKRSDPNWWAYVPLGEKVVAFECVFSGDQEVSPAAQEAALALLDSFEPHSEK